MHLGKIHIPVLFADHKQITQQDYTAKPGEERRYAYQLLAYWNEHRQGRELPVEDDIDPDHPVLAEAWADCFVVQIRDFEKAEFNYTYLGPNLVRAFADELETEEKSGIATISAAKLMPYYESIQHTRYPLISEGEFTNQRGVRIKYRQALYPFGKKSVESILGHISWQMTGA